MREREKEIDRESLRFCVDACDRENSDREKETEREILGMKERKRVSLSMGSQFEIH